MGTLADLASEAAGRRFAGRREEIAVYEDFLLGLLSHDIGILNYWGQAGLGKTSLLHRLVQASSAVPVPVIVVDLRSQTTPWTTVRDIHNQLRSDRAAKSVDEQFAVQAAQLDQLHARIIAALAEVEDGEVPSDPQSSKTTDRRAELSGAAVGEILGLFLGIPLLGVGGEAAAGAMGQKLSRRRLTKVIERSRITDADLRLLAGGLENLTRLLLQSLEARTALPQVHALLIDHYEHATPPVEAWFREDLLPRLDVRVRTVCFSRRPLTQSAQWEQLAPVIMTRELLPFTHDEASEFWDSRGISDPVKVSFLNSVTAGHPYKSDVVGGIVARYTAGTVSLRELRALVETAGVHERLEQRYLSEISLEDGLLLRRCAVPRWFDQDLLAEIGSDYATRYADLRGVSFIHRTSRGVLAMPSLAREALLYEEARTSPLELKALHLKLADHLAKRRGTTGAFGEEYLGDELYHRLSYDEIEGLAFAISALREARRVGLRAVGDILWSELAIFEFSSARGEAWSALASAHVGQRTGDWSVAVESVDKLATMDWQEAEFTLWLAELRRELLVGRGAYEAAFVLEEETLEAMALEIKAELSHDILELRARHVETAAILSKFNEAHIALKRGIDEQGDDEAGGARLALAGATSCRLSGDLVQGLQLTEKAVGIYRRIGDSKGLCFALIQNSRLETHNGQWLRAEEMLREAQELEEVARDRYNRANIKLFQANILRKRGDYLGALQLYEDSLRMHLVMRSNREIGPIYGSLALVYTALGDFETARSYLDQSFTLKRSQSYLRGVGITFKYEGLFFLAQGDEEQARVSFEQAQTIGRTCGVQYLKRWAELGLVRCQLRAGNVVTVAQWPLFDVAGSKNLGELVGILDTYGGITSEDAERAIRGMRAVVEYNPYLAYELEQAVNNDILSGSITSDVKGSLRKLIDGVWQDDDLLEAEACHRVREAIPPDIPDFAERCRGEHG